MKLWLLVPHEPYKGSWEPYGHFQGFVIAADNEAAARHLAMRTGAEGVVWLSPEMAECTLLAEQSTCEAECVVLSDFNAG